MKIALLGGSFDPVHLAHYALAHACLKQFSLDQVIWIPTSVSPFKKPTDMIASPQQRLAMTQLACSKEPKFKVSDYEINKGGISYSTETLRHFQKIFISAQFFWILGADMVSGIEKWKDSDYLIQNLTWIVVGRGPVALDFKKAMNVLQVDLAWNPISSTEIKAGLSKGLCWGHLEPLVAGYIRENRLYGAAI